MKNKKNKSIYMIMILLLLMIGVGYAILQANLEINGTAKISSNTWDIHFNNILVNEDSVSIGDGDSAAAIDSENNCKVDFSVTLSVPGDFYEFTVDVVNAGTIDGMIQNYTLSDAPDYINYTVTYDDGMSLAENQLLSSGNTETYKVRIEFKNDLEELPNAETLSTSFEVTYIQSDSNGFDRIPEADFVTDSWDTIVVAYNAGKTANLQVAMQAGTTREVPLDLDNDGTTETVGHVRIANLSTPDECFTEGFSQTACGFVIEFADIITNHVMNTTDTNVGGWPATSMRTYLNTDIYHALPSDLKDNIIDTTVVSGHGSTVGETNFTSTDNLYLLSSHEVYEFSNGFSYINYDSGYGNTRQLDYYANIAVNESVATRGGANKKYNETDTRWWLRDPHSNYANTYTFHGVQGNGLYNSYGSADFESGVSPAFRIG